MSKKLRILYAAGPGDVIGTYNYWLEGNDDPSEVSDTYSGQFFQVCRDLDAQAYIISSHKERKFLQDRQFLLEHRPIGLQSSSGLLYHWSQLWYGLRLIASAIRFQADVVVVMNGTTHWFVLSLLPLLGIAVIPSIHCTLWRKYLPQRKPEKLILRLSRQLFTRGCTAILTVSDDIAQQIAQITNGQHQKIARFSPTYRRELFANIMPPNQKRIPFRVLFVGRIEADKGVFDLLEMAKRLEDLGRQDIVFDICGTGSVLESLNLATKLAELDSRFCFHGHCNKQQIHQMLNCAHALIVPTRTDFPEGFNKVVAESILSGRPVVTSAVCPAVYYVQNAVVEVAPDNINDYVAALLKLADDREFYEQKRQGCQEVQEQFYDNTKSWGTLLKSSLRQLIPSDELKNNLRDEVRGRQISARKNTSSLATNR